jgi:hypothetical protein
LVLEKVGEWVGGQSVIEGGGRVRRVREGEVASVMSGVWRQGGNDGGREDGGWRQGEWEDGVSGGASGEMMRERGAQWSVGEECGGRCRGEGRAGAGAGAGAEQGVGWVGLGREMELELERVARGAWCVERRLGGECGLVSTSADRGPLTRLHMARVTGTLAHTRGGTWARSVDEGLLNGG